MEGVLLRELSFFIKNWAISNSQITIKNMKSKGEIFRQREFSDIINQFSILVGI